MVKPATTKSRKEQLREATEAHTPAVLAVACPYCGAQAGQCAPGDTAAASPPFRTCFVDPRPGNGSRRRPIAVMAIADTEPGSGRYADGLPPGNWGQPGT